MKEKIKQLEKYLITYLNFETLNGEELWPDDRIEYEFHLFNQEKTLYLDIIKYKEEDAPEFNLRGNVELGNKLQPYLKYFLGDRKKDLTPELEELFLKIDKQLKL